MDKIKEFFAKQSIGFYIGVVATIVMFIGTIMLATNCNMEYYKDYNPLVPLFGMLAVILACGLIVARQFVKIPHLEAVWVAVVILMGIGFMIMISMRVESMAYVLGSELESGNVLAQAAMSNFIAGAIITFIGIVAAIVASFFKITKDIK